MYDLINNNLDEDLEHHIAKLLSDNENLKREIAEHRKLEEYLKSSEVIGKSFLRLNLISPAHFHKKGQRSGCCGSKDVSCKDQRQKFCSGDRPGYY